MTAPAEGDAHVVERTFDREDVRRFAALSGDDQPRHVDPDDDGRLLVHGLLTATLPTRVGSELGVLARTMSFSFRRPVYTGETVTCEVTVEAETARDDGRRDLTADVVCRNGGGEVVLTGSFEGVVD